MTSQVLAAVLALAVLTILPGPDVAVVTRAVLARGRGASTHVTLGIACGLLVWGFLTVMGLAALLAASATAYAVVKFAGAAYLIWLGIQALLLSRRATEDDTAGIDVGAMGRPFRTGLLSNVLNPKIAVFYTSLLPQLVPSGLPHVPSLTALVLAHVALSIAWLLTYATLVGRIATTLQRPTVRRALDRLTGAVLIGFGVRVALAHD